MKNNISVEERNKIVIANMHIVRIIVRQYRHTPVDPDDLFQEGCLGLIIAAERFDSAHGVRFDSYAVCWIRKYITDAIRRYGYIITRPQHCPDEHTYTEKLDRIVGSDEGEPLTYEDVLRSHELQPDEALELSEALTAFNREKNRAKRQKNASMSENGMKNT